MVFPTWDPDALLDLALQAFKALIGEYMLGAMVDSNQGVFHKAEHKVMNDYSHDLNMKSQMGCPKFFLTF